MLARLSLRISGDVGFRQASLLQGWIMEKIDGKYADFLHRQNIHPYSLYVYSDNKKNVWFNIQTLNKDAYENIIARLNENITEIKLLKRKEEKLEIKERQLKTVAKEKLLKDFYTLPSKNKFEVDFLTPTAFRQNKQYIILPDIRLIIQSLMLKFSIASNEISMTDEETLEEMSKKIFISKHHIRSLSFPAEGQHIPGFVGNVVFQCPANETMARYFRLLMSFGEFSGIGVKTGMGMGALKLTKE